MSITGPNNNLTIRLLRHYLYGPPKFWGISAGLVARRPCRGLQLAHRARQVPPSNGAAAAGQTACTLARPPFPFGPPPLAPLPEEPPLTLLWDREKGRMRQFQVAPAPSQALGHRVDVLV